MKIVDANVIIRYLLNDVKDLAEKAVEIIENSRVYIPNEVIAEVVYVLEKVYRVDREDISSSLCLLFNYQTIEVSDKTLIFEAFGLYESRKLDFIDTLLYAYFKVTGYEVLTFDEKLSKLLK